MKKILLLTLICFTAVCNIEAQNKLNISDVKKVNVRNSGEIMDGDEVRGYFVFYVSDKIDKKTNEYTVQVSDNNLNKVKDIVFQSDKNDQILEASYNNNSIMFLIHNRKEKTLEYRCFGFDGKQKSTYTKELSKRSEALLEQTYKDEEGQNEALFNVNNNGFVTIYPVREGKHYSYEINFFFSDRNKSWSYEAAEEQEDKYNSALYLGCTDSIVFFEVIKRKKLMSRDNQNWILGINIFTGKKDFEFSTELEDYNFYPLNMARLNGTSNILLVGTYYEAGKEPGRDNTLGLAAWTVSSQGKVLAKKYNPWDGAIGKYLPTDAKGRVEDIGFLYFHKLMQTEDGNFYAVGEGYKKVVSGLGVASKVLGAMNNGGGLGVSAFKVKVTNMVVAQFDQNFNIKNAKVFEKRHNTIELSTGYEFLTPHTMALIARASGAFDYDFTQTDKFHTRITVGYSDYEKTSDYKGRTFNSITYIDGKLSTDKINLNSKSTWMRIFPAKPGYISILEYFKKEKTLEMRLEKIN
jgi:hypothetical protein